MFFSRELAAKFLRGSDSEDRAPFVMGNRSVTLGGVDGGLKQEGFLFKLFGLEKLCVLHLNPLPLPSLEFWPPVDDEADFCFEAFFVAKPVAC